MRIFGFEIGREARSAAEDPRVPVSAENFLQVFGIDADRLPAVTQASALKVPAVVAAVTFLSRTLATLPLHVFEANEGSAERFTGGLETVIHRRPNPGMGGFKFRQYFWQQVFTGGRGLAWIERGGNGEIVAIWPLDPTKVTIKRRGLKLVYSHGGREMAQDEVLDLAFMLKPDMTGHHGPIAMASKAIQLALAMGDYASGFFAGGGVPPLALVGPMPAGADAIRRAQGDVRRAIDAAKSKHEPVFPIPSGYELRPVGFDPEKGQMTDARRFQVEEIARGWQMPPVFLQDLTHGTFANTEQQDLHLVKHLIAQWAEAFEDECNLKLFPGEDGVRYVEHSIDGLLRGDFKSRMEGYGLAIQNAIRTPDEVRRLENIPAKGGDADKLHIQGATVPLGSQSRAAPAPTQPDNGGEDAEEQP